MNTMYEVCSPSILGDFSLTEWRDDVLSYADKRNVFLFATDVTALASFHLHHLKIVSSASPMGWIGTALLPF